MNITYNLGVFVISTSEAWLHYTSNTRPPIMQSRALSTVLPGELIWGLLS